MKPGSPEIGIALAAYEPKADFFLEQLVSIQEQSVPDFFCLITLDSPLPEYLTSKEFERITQDPRFRFSQNEARLGHKKNFEHAARQLLAEFPSIPFIAFCDQDDIWYPGKLALSLKTLSTLPPYSGVQTDMNLYIQTEGGFSVVQDRSGTPVSGWAFEKKIPEYRGLPALIANNHIAGTAMTIRSEVIRDHGVIPDSFEFHDHWYGLICTLLGEMKPIPVPGLLYRQHGLNVTGASKGAGLLTIRAQSGIRGALKESLRRFRGCQERVRDLSQSLNRPFRMLRFLYLSRIDFAFGFLFALAWLLLARDTRRARSVLSMWVGKVLWMTGAYRLIKP
jgi:hypothetical protein